MYNCNDCHFQLPSIKALCYHLQIIHSYNVFSVYKCAQNNCSREYNSIKAFRKHLKNKHSAHMLGEVPLQQILHQEYLAEVNENVELNLNMRNALENGNQNEHIEDINNDITSLDFKRIIFESARALVAKLYAPSTFNRAHVQEVIELISEVSFLSKQGFQRDVIFHFEEKNLIDCYNYNDFQQVLPPGLENSIVVKEATIYNTKYKRNMVLVCAINSENNLPLFGLLHWIVKQPNNDRVSFILSIFYTVGFNSHLHCYEVTPTMEYHFQEYQELISFYPTSCRIGADGNSYISFRHIL